MNQYDENTAFLDAVNDGKLFAKTPEPFRDTLGKLMLAICARYNLKEPPIVRFSEFRRQISLLCQHPFGGFPLLRK